MKLIALYYYVCDRYDKELYWVCQRHSPNQNALISDQELLTIYLFAATEASYFKLSAVHRYAEQYLLSWFPTLPSYSRFNRRMNRLSEAFRLLLEDLLCEHFQSHELSISLAQAAVDSMPIMLAQGQRAKHAKVAKQVADYAICKSKGTWFHGLKLHALGVLKPRALPVMIDLCLSPASAHDGTVFKNQIAPRFNHLTIFADKIYDDRPAVENLAQQQCIQLLAGQRRRAYHRLTADQHIQNSYVSRKRQPIESFFNWLIQHTQIQIASTVRSLKGLFLFVYARLCAAFVTLKSWTN